MVLQVPGIRTSIAQMDWLHCVDLGVAADTLGHGLLDSATVLPGRNVQMQADYACTRVAADKLNTIAVTIALTMLRKTQDCRFCCNQHCSCRDSP